MGAKKLQSKFAPDQYFNFKKFMSLLTGLFDSHFFFFFQPVIFFCSFLLRWSMHVVAVRAGTDGWAMGIGTRVYSWVDGRRRDDVRSED